jgi:acyl-CoA synthetase (NDP forming)
MSLHYLKQAGFAGPIWPVNPTRESVQGLKSYASVGALPEAPDVAVIATPAHLVQQTVEECAARGVRALVIFAVGFSEAGEAGRQAEQRMLETARAANMRVLGPNCLGCFNSAIGFYGTISISLACGLPRAGNVAVVSQSGAYGEQTAHLLKQRGLGVRYLVTTGNENDVDVGEVIDWMAEQSEVDVIVAYSEGVRNARRFLSALEHARAANKQIVFMKVGRSSAGMAAAASHTASLAGDDRFWDAALRKFGVFRARSTEEQVDIAYAAARRILPVGRKVGILTVSGGFGIQLCDAAATYDLDVTPLSAEASQRLQTLLPFGSIQNPIDASGQIVAHLEKLEESLVYLACEAGYDATVAILGSIALAPGIGPVLVQTLLAAAKRLTGRLLVLCCVADADTVETLENAGYLVFSDGFDAARAISSLATLAEGRLASSGQPRLSAPSSIGNQPLSEHGAKALLRRAGIPVLDERLTHSAREAVQAAQDFGYPVALKICSAKILHKTEIGGVLLSLGDAQAVREGYGILLERAAVAGHPAESIEGVLVAPMARKGVETILGVQVDPVFGPAVVFGLGGVHVEVLRDASLRLAPIDESEAHAMIREIRAFPLLQGVRGGKTADTNVVARALVALSRFAAENADRLATIDINPFVVWNQGEGGAALDALVVAAQAPSNQT